MQFLEGHVRMIKQMENNILLEKATQHIRKSEDIDCSRLNFKTCEPGNLRTVFKTGKLTV